MCDCDGMMYVCDACHDGDIITRQRARIAELEARLAGPQTPAPVRSAEPTSVLKRLKAKWLRRRAAREARP